MSLPQPSRHQDWISRVAWALAVGAIYFATARAALLFAFPGSNATPIWPPSGLATALVLVWGRQAVPGILLGAATANLVTFLGAGLAVGEAVVASLFISLGNAAEAVLCAGILRRCTGGGGGLGSSWAVLAFVFAAASSSVVAAAIGVSSLILFAGLAPDLGGVAALTWWIGDAVGILLIGPLVLSWLNARAMRGTAWERWIVAPVVFAVSLLLLDGRSGVPTPLLPMVLLGVLLWPALRLGLREVALSLSLVSGVAIWLTIHGRGPWGGGDRTLALVALQAWIGGGSVVLYLLAAPRAPLPASTGIQRPPGAIAWRALILGIVGLALTTLLWRSLQQEQRQLVVEEQHRTLVKLGAIAENHLTQLSQSLRRLSDRWSRQIGSAGGQAHLHQEMLAYLRDFPDLRALEWLDGSGTVRLVEPQAGNAHLLGQVLHQDAKRRAVLNRSRDLRLPQATALLDLGQGGPGFLIVVAVGSDPEQGWIVGVVSLAHLQEVLSRSLHLINDQQIDLLLRDDSGRRLGTSEALIWHDLSVLGSTWSLGLPKDFRATAGNPILPILVLTLGTLLSALFAISVQLAHTVSGRARDLRAANERLAAESEKAFAATKAKSAFLATMSHEIRTPMNGVIGAAELLSHTGLNAEQRDYLETIRSSGTSLLALINDILDLSKIEADRLDLELIPCDPVQVAEEALGLVVDQAVAKGLDLRLRLGEALPPLVRSDPVRLRQILLNLLSNAVKFTSSGRVCLDLDLDGTRLVAAVSDSGIGMDESAVQRLFQPFSQGESSTTRRYGGTGLGLAISRRLARALGGDLTVVSAKGAGSTFTLAVPVEPIRGPMPAHGLAGHRVWVDLPDEEECDLVRFWLRRCGVILVDRAGDAEVAICGDYPDGTVVDREDPGIPVLPIGAGGVLHRPLRGGRLRAALADLVMPPDRRPDAVGSDRLLDRALVVEDNPVNRKLAVAFLHGLARTVETAQDGREAVIKVSDRAFDLILMDCQMPEMDGFAATRAIRERERSLGRHTLIIALTANAFEEDRRACLAAGMDDFLTKPVHVEDLHRVLARHRR